jgi:hypothetical protein
MTPREGRRHTNRKRLKWLAMVRVTLSRSMMNLQREDSLEESGKQKEGEERSSRVVDEYSLVMEYNPESLRLHSTFTHFSFSI